MKKVFLCVSIIFCCLLITGCKKSDEKGVISDFKKSIDKSKGYILKGELEILNNEDSYLYDVNVVYKKGDNYKVSLKNKINNHEQIILRNKDGVYVLTPSLNKSFKFQSEWPYNNSQSYLLQTLLKDIENDDERTFSESEDGYVIGTKVNYSNNKDLVKQNIYFNEKKEITEVHVLDGNDTVRMKMKFNEMDMNANVDEKVFSLDANVSLNVSEQSESTGKIEDIIYPMYLPENTHLSSQDTVATDSGERIILTFDGEKPFMLVQETASIPSDLTTVIVDGEPEMFVDTVGVVSDSSVTWVSNGIEYYVVSDKLDKDELVSVAKSVSVMPVGK